MFIEKSLLLAGGILQPCRKQGSEWIISSYNKKFDDISTAEVLVIATNAYLAILKTQLIENSENLNRLRKEQKK